MHCLNITLATAATYLLYIEDYEVELHDTQSMCGSSVRSSYSY